ncbi:MAG: flagellar protein FlgN [Gemmatimonadetes bacterium]|nr:flagellar protein FlgN [Gemmatimonadota bacterium]
MIATGRMLRVDGETPSDEAIEELAEAIGSECHLLDELHDLVRRQRDALAHDDLQGVEDTVYATHRVLLTLREARRRRGNLNHLFGWAEASRLSELDDLLGERMDPALRAARDRLCDRAQALSREVEVNRSVLRTALAATDDYARTLYAGAPSGDGPYPSAPGRIERGSPVLFDRTA